MGSSFLGKTATPKFTIDVFEQVIDDDADRRERKGFGPTPIEMGYFSIDPDATASDFMAQISELLGRVVSAKDIIHEDPMTQSLDASGFRMLMYELGERDPYVKRPQKRSEQP